MAQVSQEQLKFINLELESWNYFHLKTKHLALAHSHYGSVQWNFGLSLVQEDSLAATWRQIIHQDLLC